MAHPLDPLSAEEIEAAVAIFRSQHEPQPAFFCSVGLLEPAKSAVKAGEATDRIVRLLGKIGRAHV